jgi:hypothetical protein
MHRVHPEWLEAVDDVKFTGDTILRAMRAYSCIDRHGRWTEIPTQVHISTFRDPGPAPSPSPHPENDSDVIDIEPEYSNRASRRDALSVTEDDPDDDDPDADPDNDGSENETAQAVRSDGDRSSNSKSSSSGSESPSSYSSCSYPRKLSRSCRRIQAVAVRPLPLALIHPRKQCRETQFAAIIRKVGRCLTTPLAQACPELQGAHPRKTLHITPRPNQPPLHNPALCSIRIRRRAATIPLALLHPRKHSRSRSDILAPTGSALLERLVRIPRRSPAFLTST